MQCIVYFCLMPKSRMIQQHFFFMNSHWYLFLNNTIYNFYTSHFRDMSLTSIIDAVRHQERLLLAKIYFFFQHIYFQKYSDLVVKYMVLIGISAVLLEERHHQHQIQMNSGGCDWDAIAIASCGEASLLHLGLISFVKLRNSVLHCLQFTLYLEISKTVFTSSFLNMKFLLCLQVWFWKIGSNSRVGVSVQICTT